MSKSKFTPGPWATENMVGDCTMIYCVGGFGIARTFAPGEGGARVTTSEEETANAHLIAAAPDLLEIAKRYVEAKSKDLRILNRDARAVIAKATGGE